DRMEAQIRDASIQKAASIHTEERVLSLERVGDQWRLRTSRNTPEADILFDAVILATPAHTTASLLAPLDVHLPALLPQHASSAIIVGLAFAPEQARSLRIPRGFGFLVPQRKSSRSSLQADAHDTLEATAQRAFLACTFVDQKFAHRAPAGGVLLRGFFGGADAPALLAESDTTLLRLATESLSRVLGKLPEPNFHIVRRWPRSLPLYAVGHLERMAKMEQYLAAFPGLRLVGNAYYGVGLPDLIRSGRAAAQGMFT
ncbi:MAG TPA: FAD-dependent oxidoreductase, partial [Acidobacteriaceae bacterium]|nr:FAD-dependent oxidoreductase [Acidobacteriaceae bacterium]